MRAFIHAFRGRPWNKECCDAKDGFHKLGIETVMFTTNEEFDLRKPEDVVVGGTVIVLHALHQRGIVPDHYDYPKELAFQAFLMMVCVGIYGVLVATIQITADLHAFLFGIGAYTVLLCYTLFKTGSLSRQIFNSH